MAPVQLFAGARPAQIGEAAQQRRRARAGPPCAPAGRRGRSGCRARTRGGALGPVDVERLGVRVVRRASRLAAARQMITCAAGRDRHAADARPARRRSGTSRAARARRSGAAPRRRPRLGRVRTAARRAARDGVSRATTLLPMRLVGRVVARHDQLEDRRQQLLVAEPLVAVACADRAPLTRSSPGVGLLGLDERVEHRHDGVGRRLGPRVLLGVEVRASNAVSSRPEPARARLGHAEQLADHGERQRERERGDEVDPARRALAPRCRRAARRRSPAPWGRSPSTRRTENAADTSRRSRVWSGGSTLSMCRAKAGPGRPSATTSGARWPARPACPWRAAGRSAAPWPRRSRPRARRRGRRRA